MSCRTGVECPLFTPSGGEPVVRLVDAARRGRGGRNQQLALAALEAFWDDRGRDRGLSFRRDRWRGRPHRRRRVLFDAGVILRPISTGLCREDFLVRNDAYRFFELLGALLKTGPTHTNVGDLRVVVTGRR